jgi:hypothetical protein
MYENAKTNFTKSEIEEIRLLVRELEKSNKTEQKNIRSKMRDKYNFYITKFDTSYSGFREQDLDKIIKDKRITITK